MISLLVAPPTSTLPNPVSMSQEPLCSCSATPRAFALNSSSWNTLSRYGLLAHFLLALRTSLGAPGNSSPKTPFLLSLTQNINQACTGKQNHSWVFETGYLLQEISSMSDWKGLRSQRGQWSNPVVRISRKPRVPFPPEGGKKVPMWPGWSRSHSGLHSSWSPEDTAITKDAATGGRGRHILASPSCPPHLPQGLSRDQLTEMWANMRSCLACRGQHPPSCSRRGAHLKASWPSTGTTSSIFPQSFGHPWHIYLLFLYLD